jgi:hypothetical protein
VSRKFIIITGLPGSGKSHYVQSLGMPFQDDWIEEVKSLEGSIIDAPVVALVSVKFIDAPFLEVFVISLRSWFPECEIEYVAFENDPDQCWQNVHERICAGDLRPIPRWAIYERAKRYTYPEGAKILPVWKDLFYE